MKVNYYINKYRTNSYRVLTISIVIECSTQITGHYIHIFPKLKYERWFGKVNNGVMI